MCVVVRVDVCVDVVGACLGRTEHMGLGNGTEKRGERGAVGVRVALRVGVACSESVVNCSIVEYC